jgi:transglutaminase-like putative cysteine protease
MQGVLNTTIPSGDAGTFATLDYMARLASQGAVTPAVRDVAASLVQGTGRDPQLHCRLVSDWVEQHVEFLPDPSVAEALVPPGVAVGIIAARGVLQADCDDVAMLAAALGLSIGLRARFVVVAFGSPSAPFAHVWTDLSAPDGASWLTVDPTRPMFTLPPIGRSVVQEV